MDDLEVDSYGFVWLGGVKICRVTSWDLIEFYDRDSRRSSRRGSSYVYVSLYELLQVLGLYVSKEPIDD